MIVSAPGRAFASWTAARRVHWLPALAQIPSPGEASTASIVLVTLNVAARARVAVTNRHTGPTRRRSSALTAPLLKMLRIILVVANGGSLRIPRLLHRASSGRQAVIGLDRERLQGSLVVRTCRLATLQQHRATSGCAFPLTRATLRRYRLRAAGSVRGVGTARGRLARLGQAAEVRS